MSPSPIDTHPRHFLPGTLFDTQAFECIQLDVHNSSKPLLTDDEDDNDDDDDDDDKEDLHDILNQARTIELDYLSQLIQRDRPTDTNEITDLLFDLIGHVPEPTTVIDIHTYPLMNQTGIVADCDRPYADYGHLDRQTLAQEFQFNFQQPSSTNQPSSLRLNAKIICYYSMDQYF